MNTMNIEMAESYYNAMLAEDFETMSNYLHDDVHFIGPLAEMQGKEAVVSAAKKLRQILGKIEIRSRFSDGHQVMFAYDFYFPALTLKLRSAVLMDIKEGKIARIELFYDSKAFEQKKEEIFVK